MTYISPMVFLKAVGTTWHEVCDGISLVMTIILPMICLREREAPMDLESWWMKAVTTVTT